MNHDTYWNYKTEDNSYGIKRYIKENDLNGLLNYEGLIQEIKLENNELITFLIKEENLRKIISYIIEEPVGKKKEGNDLQDECENEEEDEVLIQSFKYSYKCHQIICTENRTIISSFAYKESLMKYFWSFLLTKEKLNDVLSGYFSKVATTLYTLNTVQVVGFLKPRKELYLKAFLYHFYSRNITELFKILIFVKVPYYCIFDNKDLMFLILCNLNGNFSSNQYIVSDREDNVTCMVRDIFLRKSEIVYFNYFFVDLTSQLSLSYLIKCLFSKCPHTISAAITIISDLLNYTVLTKTFNNIDYTDCLNNYIKLDRMFEMDRHQGRKEKTCSDRKRKRKRSLETIDGTNNLEDTHVSKVPTFGESRGEHRTQENYDNYTKKMDNTEEYLTKENKNHTENKNKDNEEENKQENKEEVEKEEEEEEEEEEDEEEEERFIPFHFAFPNEPITKSNKKEIDKYEQILNELKKRKDFQFCKEEEEEEEEGEEGGDLEKQKKSNTKNKLENVDVEEETEKQEKRMDDTDDVSEDEEYGTKIKHLKKIKLVEVLNRMKEIANNKVNRLGKTNERKKKGFFSGSSNRSLKKEKFLWGDDTFPIFQKESEETNIPLKVWVLYLESGSFVDICFFNYIKDIMSLYIEHINVNKRKSAVGVTTLEIIQLIKTLVKTNSKKILTEIIDGGFFDILIDTFFKFKWNNLLHISVCDLLQTLIFRENEYLYVLYYILAITSFLPKCLRYFDGVRRCRKIKNKEKRKTLEGMIDCGYKAHLLHICQILSNKSIHVKWLSDFLNSVAGWNDIIIEELEYFSTYFNENNDQEKKEHEEQELLHQNEEEDHDLNQGCILHQSGDVHEYYNHEENEEESHMHTYLNEEDIHTNEEPNEESMFEEEENNQRKNNTNEDMEPFDLNA